VDIWEKQGLSIAPDYKKLEDEKKEAKAHNE